MTDEKSVPPLETWAVVELMGHTRLAGKLTEETHCGAVLGRLDIPLDGDKWLTQFFSGSAVFRITPCDEATARAAAAHCAPAPISRYEMPQLTTATRDLSGEGAERMGRHYEDDDDGFDDRDDEPDDEPEF